MRDLQNSEVLKKTKKIVTKLHDKSEFLICMMNLKP